MSYVDEVIELVIAKNPAQPLWLTVFYRSDPIPDHAWLSDSVFYIPPALPDIAGCISYGS